MILSVSWKQEGVELDNEQNKWFDPGRWCGSALYAKQRLHLYILPGGGKVLDGWLFLLLLAISRFPVFLGGHYYRVGEEDVHGKGKT